MFKYDPVIKLINCVYTAFKYEMSILH